MGLINYSRRIVEYSFYLIFFLVPLIFWGSTSELFELNKIWLTYALTIIIVSTWVTEIILQKRFFIKKTPLDIPIVIFLMSQIISTIFSLDPHVSFFGYYSRFNGGLLSTISYIFLYYAFVSHFNTEKTIRLVKITLLSGLIVVLWGIPSHFGLDPTCLVFRRELNVSCWTEAFKPTIRMFSTLGQPAWLAAYIAVLIPVAIATFLQIFIHPISQPANSLWQMANGKKLFTIYYLLLTFLLYVSLLYTNTRAGFIGFWIANIIFWILILLKRLLSFKYFIILFVIFNFSFLTLNFFTGTPIQQLNRFTLNSITKQTLRAQEASSNTPPDNLNITNSADIRRVVWNGAIDAWRAYPVFGSGVETFAFAYYKYRPVEHNLTSEWDYLYNKAHNEFLNYLTTTGAVGLGSYLLIIGVFTYLVTKKLFNRSIIQLLKSNNRTTLSAARQVEQSSNEYEIDLLSIGLFAGWVSILITNFFGFSVVIMNLLFFLIPACIFMLNKNTNKVFSLPSLPENQTTKKPDNHISVSQWIGITFVLLTNLYLLLMLFRHWQADKAYSLGSNFNRSNYAQEAYPLLQEAVKLRPEEPVFKDELSNSALYLSLILFSQNEATKGAEFAQNAIDLNTDILTNHPNYLPFWKSRVRILYALSELAPIYKNEALKAAQKASILAPTDAKVWYNLGILYGSTDNTDKGIEILKKTIHMKPDYQDAIHGLGLLYRQKAVDEENNVIDPRMNEMAIETMNKLLEINPDHTPAKESLKEWSNK